MIVHVQYFYFYILGGFPIIFQEGKNQSVPSEIFEHWVENQESVMEMSKKQYV